MKLKHMRLLMILGLLLPLTVLCQKREYKRGLALENQGEIILAMDQYRAALYKNMYFTRAKVALERSANTRVERLLSDYFVARQKGNWEEAQKISNSVTTFRDEMKYFSIEIKLPDYQEARLIEDRQKMQEASVASQASEKKLEIKHKASRSFEAGNYFLAYDLYSDLLASDPENEDYQHNLEQSKVRGSISIAVMDLGDSKARQTRSLKAAILSKIAQWSHPLLTMIEREDLNVLIEEQKQVFTGLFDESTTAAPGMLKGVKHLLLIRLEDIQHKRSEGNATSQTAYEKIRSKVFDEAGNWRITPKYLPRQYTQKSGHVSMTAALHCKLIEVETGRILTANKVAGNIKDEKVVSIYEGDANALFPIRNGEIVITGEYVRKFRESFGDQRVLKTENQLFYELEQQLALEAVTHLKEALLGGKL